MNWKQCAASAGLGLTVGWILAKQFDNNKLSAEKALGKVKAAVGSDRNIDGSWIHMTPERVERNGLVYDVYEGGLTLTDNDSVSHYDFTVDARTGTVLEMSSTE